MLLLSGERMLIGMQMNKGYEGIRPMRAQNTFLRLGCQHS